jgi:hypothetical protein
MNQPAVCPPAQPSFLAAGAGITIVTACSQYSGYDYYFAWERP